MPEPVGVSEDAGRASKAREVLVDELVANGVIISPLVEAAFQTVPRHAFVSPDTPLEEVYAVDRAVITKRDENGAHLSSVSVTFIWARMIQQAGVGPGMRVLEIGSGGYNAALLAEVVETGGWVVSVDIDAEVTGRARVLLAETGYGGRVEVVKADAEHGLPGEGKFDRILVTVGAWDVPPAWLDHLAAHGVIVVPLRMNGVTRMIAFRRDGEHPDHLVSTSAEVAGFVPMQGAGARPERILRLPDGQGRYVSLRFDVGPPENPGRLDGVLGTARTQAWSGVTIEHGVSFADLNLWLAGFLPGFCLLAGRWFPFGVVRGDSFAFLATRPTADDTGVEFGARSYGPPGQDPAAAPVEQIQAWDRQARHAPEPTFTYWPNGVNPAGQLSAGGGRVATMIKTHGLISICWPAS